MCDKKVNTSMVAGLMKLSHTCAVVAAGCSRARAINRLAWMPSGALLLADSFCFRATAGVSKDICESNRSWSITGSH